MPTLCKNSLLQAIHDQENLRARMVVERYRNEVRNTPPSADILSNPVRSRRIISSEMRYDETCFHREFDVVRCEIADERKHMSVEQAAKLQSIETADALKIKGETFAENKTTAHNRYTHAIGGVAMNQVPAANLASRCPIQRNRPNQKGGSAAKTNQCRNLRANLHPRIRSHGANQTGRKVFGPIPH